MNRCQRALGGELCPKTKNKSTGLSIQEANEMEYPLVVAPVTLVGLNITNDHASTSRNWFSESNDIYKKMHVK